MGRLKRQSRALAEAKKRIAAMESIDPELDFGSGISLANFADAATSLDEVLAEYNTQLSHLDEQLNRILALEAQLREAGARLLSGVAARFGTDSHEYEKAGGTRKSERKRPRRRASAGSVAASNGGAGA